VTENDRPSIRPNDKSLAVQGGPESSVPPKLIQDRINKWQRVKLRNHERFKMAVAQEKVVLMNRVVGKINYEGRVR
jgi:hypothetical protein